MNRPGIVSTRIAILLLVVAALPVSAQQCDKVQGEGESLWSARQEAIRLALQASQAQLVMADRRIIDGEIVEDAVRSTLNGFVESIRDVEVVRDITGFRGTFEVCVSSTNVGLFLRQTVGREGRSAVDGNLLLARVEAAAASENARLELMRRVFQASADAWYLRIDSIGGLNREQTALRVRLSYGYDPDYVAYATRALTQLGWQNCKNGGCQFSLGYNEQAFDVALGSQVWAMKPFEATGMDVRMADLGRELRALRGGNQYVFRLLGVMADGRRNPLALLDHDDGNRRCLRPADWYDPEGTTGSGAITEAWMEAWGRRRDPLELPDQSDLAARQRASALPTERQFMVEPVSFYLEVPVRLLRNVVDLQVDWIEGDDAVDARSFCMSDSFVPTFSYVQAYAGLDSNDDPAKIVFLTRQGVRESEQWKEKAAEPTSVYLVGETTLDIYEWVAGDSIAGRPVQFFFTAGGWDSLTTTGSNRIQLFFGDSRRTALDVQDWFQFSVLGVIGPFETSEKAQAVCQDLSKTWFRAVRTDIVVVRDEGAFDVSNGCTMLQGRPALRRFDYPGWVLLDSSLPTIRWRSAPVSYSGTSRILWEDALQWRK